MAEPMNELEKLRAEVEALKARKIDVDDLPVRALRQKIMFTQEPLDSPEVLMPRSVTRDLLRADLVAQIDAAAPPPTGAMMMFGGASAPTGWLLCDGAPVTASTYPALHALLAAAGYPYGGSGSSANLPDLQGRMPVGLGTHASVNALGLDDGTVLGSRRPEHAHSGVTSSDATGATVDSATTGINVLHNATGLTVVSGGSHSHTITDPGHDHWRYDSSVGFSRAGYTNAAGSHSHTTYGNRVNNRQGNLSGGVITQMNLSTAGNTGTTSSNGSHNHNQVTILSDTTGISINTTNSSHGHSVSDPGHDHQLTDPGHGHTLTDPTHDHTVSVGSGGGTADAPSFIVVQFIIKA